MRSIKSTGTRPEKSLASVLRRSQLRFRAHPKGVEGKPDFVLYDWRLAIFLDGDFWHGRQWRTRGFRSLEDQLRNCNNRSYWIRKIHSNAARDRAVSRRLRKSGWSVIRIWEGDWKQRPNVCLKKIMRTVERRRAGQ
ncbi:MAG: DNA mismatch endonuclease Vsr [Acidobacteriales bacterium]|nr:DNA mismatch endonuclease Vsr [Terriglobales bacterium]